MTDVTYDLVIVGAGLMGSCAAWAAGRRGLRAAVLEQYEPGHTHGSSHGTSRIFRRAYGDPFYVELSAAADDSWSRLEDDAGAALRTFTGAVDHGRERDPHALSEALTRAAVPHSLLTAAEATERWPHLVFTTDVLHHPDAGVLDADLAVATALDRACHDGIEVHPHTTVTAIVPGPDSVEVHVTITAPGETISPAPDHTAGSPGELLRPPPATAIFRARRIVLAVGPWNQRWLPELLGTSAPTLTVTQQQVVHFRQLTPAPTWPVMVFKDDLEIFAMPAGRAAPGAIKLGEHDRGTVTTAGERDGVVDPSAVERMVGFVEKYLPSLDPEPFAALSCLYTRTPTEDFVVDAVSPLIVCSPCSGHGAKFAAYIGELVVSMAAGNGNPPDRFRLATVTP